ncbi:MAG: type II secretion system F family protein [Planctomycetes bacterium]|nr:type II secretion system F family protein [Planctomycetota bacterium]
MPLYDYVAVGVDGTKVRDQMVAQDAEHLATALAQRGMVVRSVREASKERRQGSSVRLKPRQLVALSYQLQTLLDAGVPIVTSIQELLKEEKNPRVRGTLQGIAASLEGGATVSEALSRFPRTFGPLYLAMVRSGEEAGTLPDSLRKLADYLDWAETTKGMVRQAFVYPAILAVIVSGLVWFLLTGLIPKITKVMADAGAELPVVTKMLVAMSDFLVNWWYLVALAIAGVVAAFLAMRASAGGRRIQDAISLRLPVLGILLHKSCSSRFANTLGNLHSTGVEMVRTLEICRSVVGNEWMAQAIDGASRRVSQGERLSDALRPSGAFPALVVTMIHVGEESGHLVETLAQVSRFYDREVPAAVKAFITVLEPLLVVCSAFVVGFVIVGALLPVFTLIQKISEGTG